MLFSSSQDSSEDLPSSPCPAHFHYIGGMCYFVSHSRVSQAEALSTCQKAPGGGLLNLSRKLRWNIFHQYLRTWRLSGGCDSSFNAQMVQLYAIYEKMCNFFLSSHDYLVINSYLINY